MLPTTERNLQNIRCQAADIGERMKTKYRRKMMSVVLFWLVGFFLMFSRAAQACQTFDEIGITTCITLFSSAYVNLPDSRRTVFDANAEKFFTRHPDNLLFQPNEALVVLDGNPQKLSELVGFPIHWHLEVRPHYDSTYDATGFGQGQYHSFLSDLATNVSGDQQNNFLPLIREYYVDLHPKHFFIRLGRQIIAWGKSDGVYMLDILNNFNLINPQIFNEQQIKIPVWAANINWQATNSGELQGVFIPQTYPTYYTGLQFKGGFPINGSYGDFTYNSVALINNELNGSLGFKIPTDVNTPSTRLNNWTYAARWSEQRGSIHYTLNYLYTWTTSMIYYPNTGTYLTATSINLHPHRMTVAGGSADYEFNTGNAWLDGTVLRAESAVTNGDVYYEGTVGNPVDVTHWGFLGGLDRYILGDYLERPVFFSFQYWQDWVLRRNNKCACGPYSNEFQDIGYGGSHSGFRGLYKSLSTLYLDKTWLTGDILDSSLSVVHDWEFNDWWLQPHIGYRISDKTTLGLGFNVYAGQQQTPYGEFTNLSNVFFEIHQVLL